MAGMKKAMKKAVAALVAPTAMKKAMNAKTAMKAMKK